MADLIHLTHRGADGQPVTATVNPTGAALVGLRFGTLDVVQPLPDPTTPPRYAGATLAPWPNRIRDGVWTLGGVTRRLECNDPSFHSAVHGLVGHTRFTGQPDRDRSRVDLSTQVAARPGYPFDIALTVTYQVGEDGLTVRYTAHNAGGNPAPFAVGAHPYFVVGDEPTGDLVLTVPADTVLVNDEAAIPVGRQHVARTTDLRTGRRVASAAFNHCFTDLALTRGEYVCTLAGQHATVEVWGETAFGYWQVYSPPDFPGPSGPTRAVALEPMTAPPDAFNSGEGLRWLEPGTDWSASWGVRTAS